MWTVVRPKNFFSCFVMDCLIVVWIFLCCFSSEDKIYQVSAAQISRENSENSRAIQKRDYDDDDDDYESYCISLPQDTPHFCLRNRLAKLKENNATYRLSKPPKMEYNPSTLNKVKVFGFFLFPLLDMTTKEVLLLSAKDPKERKLSELYIEMVKRNNALSKEKVKIFETFCDYAELVDYYRKKQQTGASYDRYFKFPSQEEKFKDIISTDNWQDDQVFVEQRLAGMNPMSLRKLTLEEFMDNSKRFSPDLDRAIKRVIYNEKTSFRQMIEEGSIFIADYPLINNLTNIADVLDSNPNDERNMRESKCPIAVFVSVKNCHTKMNELKSVAIQMDYSANSEVIIPTDGSRWQLAKQEIQLADVTHLQIVEHLLKTHLMMEPICVTIKRTLSVYHPLNAVLQWHCRGTFLTNSVGLPNLVNQYGYMHKLLAIGDVGSIELLNRAYLTVTWDDTDFEGNLKKRGVDDQEKLPYFPYRDDGIVIWKEIKEFAKRYVNMYYQCTEDITNDRELQSFANELSADGMGSTGGMGMLKKFPSKIEDKKQLIDIFARIIFLPIQHHTVAYPVEYYASFVPNMPTKLYDDPRIPTGEFGVYSLPESVAASIQVALAMSLASFRYDKLFDYYWKLSDGRASDLLYQHHYYLMGPVREMLEKRNKRRLQEGHLTYPYFLPNWIPNSIHA